MPIEKSVLAGAIAAHWDGLKRQNVVVPEWGTTIWFDPVTIAERDKLRSASSNEFAVEAIIMKATDEAGGKLFTKGDKLQLMNAASSAVISRIANRILSADAVDVDLLEEH